MVIKGFLRAATLYNSEISFNKKLQKEKVENQQ